MKSEASRKSVQLELRAQATRLLTVVGLDAATARSMGRAEAREGGLSKPKALLQATTDRRPAGRQRQSK
eukprot:3427798-Prymnesium_polylepis.1